MTKFLVDHRENEGLHELYVRWAMNHLSHAQDYVELMSHFSNFSADQLYIPVREAMAKLIREDAAYHDAAARLFAGEDVPEYLPGESDNADENLSVDIREASFRAEAAAPHHDVTFPAEKSTEGPAKQVHGRDSMTADGVFDAWVKGLNGRAPTELDFLGLVLSGICGAPVVRLV